MLEFESERVEEEAWKVVVVEEEEEEEEANWKPELGNGNLGLEYFP